MEKQDAIDAFFMYNDINAQWVADGIYSDPKLEHLSKQIDLWLQDIHQAHHSVFLRMLSRYTYITELQAAKRYSEAVDLLEEHLSNQNRTLSEAVFISVESPSHTKCGSDNVRTDLHRKNVSRMDASQIIATARKMTPQSLSQYTAIVFVDDIVSTGFTLRHTINAFAQQFPQIMQQNIPVFCICIVPTKSGLRHLCDKVSPGLQVVPIYREEWQSDSLFKRGIFEHGEREYTEKTIGRYETMIDAYMKEEDDTYAWGFRQSKQLVSFYYNTPNNTLCSF